MQTTALIMPNTLKTIPEMGTSLHIREYRIHFHCLSVLLRSLLTRTEFDWHRLD